MVYKIKNNYELLKNLVKRNISDKTAGHVLGNVWTICQPLIMMAIYMFLFAFVFPSKHGNGSGAVDFSLNILTGLLPWLMIQEVMVKSVTVYTSNANLVKQLIFPIELLPITTVVSTSIIYIPAILFVVGYSVYQNGLGMILMLVPFLYLMLICFCLGISFILASIGVVFRDIKDIVSIFCSINLFAMPILYSPSMDNLYINTVLKLNPFSYIVWSWQEVLYNSDLIEVSAIIPSIFISFLTLALGMYLYKRLRCIFGDII